MHKPVQRPYSEMLQLYFYTSMNIVVTDNIISAEKCFIYPTEGQLHDQFVLWGRET